MPIPDDNYSVKKVIEELTMSEPFKSDVEKSLNEIKESLDKLEVTIGLIKSQEPSYGMSAIENIKIPACVISGYQGVIYQSVVKEALEAEERKVREQIYSDNDDTGSIIFVSSGSGERKLQDPRDEFEQLDNCVTWASEYKVEGDYIKQSINFNRDDELEEELKKFTFDSKSRSKEEKLPKKLRRGW